MRDPTRAKTPKPSVRNAKPKPPKTQNSTHRKPKPLRIETLYIASRISEAEEAVQELKEDTRLRVQDFVPDCCERAYDD